MGVLKPLLRYVSSEDGGQTTLIGVSCKVTGMDTASDVRKKNSQFKKKQTKRVSMSTAAWNTTANMKPRAPSRAPSSWHIQAASMAKRNKTARNSKPVRLFQALFLAFSHLKNLPILSEVFRNGAGG